MADVIQIVRNYEVRTAIQCLGCRVWYVITHVCKLKQIEEVREEESDEGV